ncbi:MAG: hypothetical protein WCY84_05760, partial [Candidatus Cloacimonadaceae bacterium]
NDYLLRVNFGGFKALNPYISGADISCCCVVCVFRDSLLPLSPYSTIMRQHLINHCELARDTFIIHCFAQRSVDTASPRGLGTPVLFASIFAGILRKGNHQ